MGGKRSKGDFGNGSGSVQAIRESVPREAAPTDSLLRQRPEPLDLVQLQSSTSEYSFARQSPSALSAATIPGRATEAERLTGSRPVSATVRHSRPIRAHASSVFPTHGRRSVHDTDTVDSSFSDQILVPTSKDTGTRDDSTAYGLRRPASGTVRPDIGRQLTRSSSASLMTTRSEGSKPRYRLSLGRMAAGADQGMEKRPLEETRRPVPPPSSGLPVRRTPSPSPAPLQLYSASGGQRKQETGKALSTFPKDRPSSAPPRAGGFRPHPRLDLQRSSGNADETALLEDVIGSEEELSPKTRVLPPPPRHASLWVSPPRLRVFPPPLPVESKGSDAVRGWSEGRVPVTALPSSPSPKRQAKAQSRVDSVGTGFAYGELLNVYELISASKPTPLRTGRVGRRRSDETVAEIMQERKKGRSGSSGGSLRSPSAASSSSGSPIKPQYRSGWEVDGLRAEKTPEYVSVPLDKLNLLEKLLDRKRQTMEVLRQNRDIPLNVDL